LLSLKASSQESKPILPIISDDPEAFKHSPFYKTVTSEGDPSGMSGFMGPGPWTFQRELALPTSCTRMHFSNKNRRANILITHTLKVVFRVERGDDKYVDQKTGNRKLFDVIMQTPVNILSVSIAINHYVIPITLMPSLCVSVVAPLNGRLFLATINLFTTTLLPRLHPAHAL